MAEKGLREDIHKLLRDALKYYELKWEYFKLDIIESLAILYTRVFSILLWWIILPIFLLFVFIGLALYLGTLWGKIYLGFFAVSGIVLLLGIILFFLRKPLLANPLVNTFVSAMFNNNDQVKNKSAANEQSSANKES